MLIFFSCILFMCESLSNKEQNKLCTRYLHCKKGNENIPLNLVWQKKKGKHGERQIT